MSVIRSKKVELSAPAPEAHTAEHHPTPPYAVAYFLFFFSLVVTLLVALRLALFAAVSREPLVSAIAWQNSCTAVATLSSAHAACVASGIIRCVCVCVCYVFVCGRGPVWTKKVCY